MFMSLSNDKCGRSRLTHVVAEPSGCCTVVVAAATGEYVQARQSRLKA